LPRLSVNAFAWLDTEISQELLLLPSNAKLVRLQTPLTMLLAPSAQLEHSPPLPALLVSTLLVYYAEPALQLIKVLSTGIPPQVLSRLATPPALLALEVLPPNVPIVPMPPLHGLNQLLPLPTMPLTLKVKEPSSIIPVSAIAQLVSSQTPLEILALLVPLLAPRLLEFLQFSDSLLLSSSFFDY